jgi:phage-related protein
VISRDLHRGRDLLRPAVGGDLDLRSIFSVISGVWNSIFGFISGIVTKIAGFISGIFSGVADAIGGVFRGIGSAVHNVFDSVVGFLKAPSTAPSTS